MSFQRPARPTRALTNTGINDFYEAFMQSANATESDKRRFRNLLVDFYEKTNKKENIGIVKRNIEELYRSKVHTVTRGFDNDLFFQNLLDQGKIIKESRSEQTQPSSTSTLSQSPASEIKETMQIKREQGQTTPMSSAATRNLPAIPTPQSQTRSVNKVVDSLLSAIKKIGDLYAQNAPQADILDAVNKYQIIKNQLDQIRNGPGISTSLDKKIQEIDELWQDFFNSQQQAQSQPVVGQQALPMQQQPVTIKQPIQQAQNQMPAMVQDIAGQQPSEPSNRGEQPVSGQAFAQESTNNQSNLDDSQLLANISSNYDSLNRPALAALGADISYRRNRPVDTTNQFRENLYGPRVSGGDIRQLNRVADMDLLPLQQNVNIKLTQLRNDLVSFLDSFLEDPDPMRASEYTPKPDDTYEYDPMEIQIPEDREALMQAQSTTNAQDDAANPQAFSRNVLVPEEVDDTFKMVQRGSGNFIVKKLRHAGLKNMVRPYSDYFTTVYDYMSVPTEDRLMEVRSSIQKMNLAVQSYQEKVGPYVFQGIVLSCAVAESAIDGLLYNSSQKQRAIYQIRQYDSQMRQGVAPAVKTYAPY